MLESSRPSSRVAPVTGSESMKIVPNSAAVPKIS